MKSHRGYKICARGTGRRGSNSTRPDGIRRRTATHATAGNRPGMAEVNGIGVRGEDQNNERFTKECAEIMTGRPAYGFRRSPPRSRDRRLLARVSQTN